MKILRIRMSAYTASFRLPFAFTGVQITQPLPSYSNLLGMISCCAGKNITTKDTQIGFEFVSEGKGMDLERFIRWDFNKGKPKLNKPNVRKREYLINPRLTLYLTNIKLSEYFFHPRGILTLGRSQDLAIIEDIDEIEVNPTKKGEIGGTLIPMSKFSPTSIEGIILRLPEYMEYDFEKRLRKSGKTDVFVSTNSSFEKRTIIELNEGLYSLSEKDDPNHCIYIHKWIN